jgi:hypothetical protein
MENKFERLNAIFHKIMEIIEQKKRLTKDLDAEEIKLYEEYDRVFAE